MNSTAKGAAGARSLGLAIRRAALTTASGSAILLGTLAGASQPAHAQAAQSAPVEQIVVTGTLIERNGYQAPTPTTVVNPEQLQANAANDIADTINMLPEFSGGTSIHASGGGGSSPNKGESELSLRGLGANRTLVLMDGMRVPEASLDGATDINEVPQGLVSRVDVVTGGASAAYGSDALSGVVNFVLNKEFTGVKGMLEGGLTTYGDDGNYDMTITAGAPFAGGRGHILFNAEESWSAGIFDMPRPWNKTAWKILNNPNYTSTNGQPQLLIRPGVQLAEATQGGLINSGPLAGIAFGPGGAPYQFGYGSVAIGGVEMIGGQANDDSGDTGLDQEISRQNIFSRASFDISDNFEIWGLGSYGTGEATANCCYPFYLPSVKINAGNPFIPAAVAAQMATRGLTQLTIGRIPSDLGHTQSADGRATYRFALGASGKFDAFGSNWSIDAFAQQGIAKNTVNLHTAITPNFNNAIDAVVAPNGSTVCRTTLTNPTNGCVPYSVFGTNVNSQASIAYIDGTAQLRQNVKQDTAGFTIQGEPVSDWAGPISLATGVDYRRESTSGTADPLSATNSYFAGNFKPTFGSYTVWEGFGETVIPLAEDQSWAKSLELNAAIRGTDYSTSGFVTTWKLGVTYAPIDDIHFRATRSRDIRAPNLADLYTAGTTATGPIQDPTPPPPTPPYTSANAFTVTQGNVNLKPEVADTTGAGIIFQPTWIPGFNASIDYYNIEITGAISTVAAQDTVNRCFMGETAVCGSVIRGPTGFITEVISQEYNLVAQKTSGFDVEAGYQTDLANMVDDWKGNVTLHALGTRVMNDTTNDGENPVIELAGQNSGSGPPRWRWLMSAAYNYDPITVTVTGRAVSAGTYLNSYIVCTTTCPTSTANHMTIDGNHIDGAFYADIAVDYSVNETVNLFLIVQNIANQDPAIVAPVGGSNFYVSSGNPSLYDTLGRQFRFGLRFKM